MCFRCVLPVIMNVNDELKKKLAGGKPNLRHVPRDPPREDSPTPLGVPPTALSPPSPRPKMKSKPPAKEVVLKAEAEFSYDAAMEDEISFEEGDIFIVHNREIYDGWAEGEIKGKRGVFPNNYVRFYEERLLPPPRKAPVLPPKSQTGPPPTPGPPPPSMPAPSVPAPGRKDSLVPSTPAPSIPAPGRKASLVPTTPAPTMSKSPAPGRKFSTATLPPPSKAPTQTPDKPFSSASSIIRRLQDDGRGGGTPPSFNNKTPLGGRTSSEMQIKVPNSAPPKQDMKAMTIGRVTGRAPPPPFNPVEVADTPPAPSGPPRRAPPQVAPPTPEPEEVITEDFYEDMDQAPTAAETEELKERMGDMERKFNRLFDMLESELKDERNARKALETEVESLKKMVSMLREKCQIYTHCVTQ
eukprot:sb/3465171/